MALSRLEDSQQAFLSFCRGNYSGSVRKTSPSRPFIGMATPLPPPRSDSGIGSRGFSRGAAETRILVPKRTPRSVVTLGTLSGFIVWRSCGWRRCESSSWTLVPMGRRWWCCGRDQATGESAAAGAGARAATGEGRGSDGCVCVSSSGARACAGGWRTRLSLVPSLIVALTCVIPMSSNVHRHAGVEAWYTTRRGPMSRVPSRSHDPAVRRPRRDDRRRHADATDRHRNDAATLPRPDSPRRDSTAITPVTDWTPAGLCKS